MDLRSSELMGIVLLFLFCLTLGVLSCKPDAPKAKNLSTQSADLPSELEPLYGEIMEAHDEVMPKMSELTKLQDLMINELDTLRNQQPVDMKKLAEANRILGGLNRAENAMWSWMHNFSKLDSIPLPDKERFLQSEKTSAFSLRDLMSQSLTQATEYIKSNTDNEQ